MEPIIYKPGAYKTPGVYNGDGSVYNGHGVYNDVAFAVIGGRKYPIVKIGNMLWTIENLDWKFDGCVIGASGVSSYEPRGNYYGNNEVLYGWQGYKCGLLYNYKSVEALNNLLPDGWHIPSLTEWNALAAATLNISMAAYLLSNGDIDWAPSWTGENLFNFNIKPSGQMFGSNGAFYGIGFNVEFWTNSRYDYYRNGNKFSSGYIATPSQYSIRLVKTIS